MVSDSGQNSTSCSSCGDKPHLSASSSTYGKQPGLSKRLRGLSLRSPQQTRHRRGARGQHPQHHTAPLRPCWPLAPFLASCCPPGRKGSNAGGPRTTEEKTSDLPHSLSSHGSVKDAGSTASPAGGAMAPKGVGSFWKPRDLLYARSLHPGSEAAPHLPTDPILTQDSRPPNVAASSLESPAKTARQGGPAGQGGLIAHPPPAVNHQGLCFGTGAPVTQRPALSPGAWVMQFPGTGLWPPSGNVTRITGTDVTDPALLTQTAATQAGTGSAETKVTGKEGGRMKVHSGPRRGRSFKGPPMTWQEPPRCPRAAEAGK